MSLLYSNHLPVGKLTPCLVIPRRLISFIGYFGIEGGGQVTISYYCA